MERLAYEHRWSDVVTICFIPEVVRPGVLALLSGYYEHINDEFEEIDYRLELVQLHDSGYGIFRYVVQLPEWLDLWPDERRDRVDGAHKRPPTGFVPVRKRPFHQTS